ncbi:MAG: HAD family phosphatase [Bacteroidetes bacterium]|nr:HAD family phosphatase [Bacteroidota bacterium]MDA1121685.1 HAD family phosphatase [Bacteroidota bacterium]
MINTIVFDLGAVLIDWNPRYLYRKIFKEEKDMEWFLANVCSHEWNNELDAGLDMVKETRDLALQFPQFEAEIEAYYQRWEEMLGSQIDGTVEILKTIRDSGDYRLLALTNWSHQTFPITRQKFDFLSWFEGIVVSGDESLKKPDSEIYRVLINRYDILPSASVFIDDSKPNIDTAIRLGFSAVHFKGPEKLRTDLIDLGLLRN